MNESVALSEHRFSDQNFLVIWLNENINQSDDNYCNTLNQLRQIFNKIVLFTDVDECVDYLTEIIDEKIFVIISADYNQQLVFLIEDAAQIYSIYVIRDSDVRQNLWTSKFKKVKTVSRSMKDLCELLEQDTRKCEQGLIPISIISSVDYSKESLNELPASFMYLQILKEILFDIGQYQNAKEDLVHSWYEQYHDNECQLKKIGEFERDYRPDLAIRWYTRENFIYSILNRALRTLDVEVTIKMGFFLRDLNQQIKHLHDEQSKNQVRQTLYRGQEMHNDEFEKLRNSRGGVLSFNSFLSTSIDPNVSKMYCSIPPQDPNMTAVLFKMEIDPTIKCAPFALLNDQSKFSDEQEVLFSMHSVYRIVEVREIERDLWQATLVLTSDDDKELKQLTEYIRNEIQGATGWHRLGHLLIKIGNFDKAEAIYQMLLKETPIHDHSALTFLYNQIGLTKHRKEEFQDALEFYYKNLQIEENSRSPNYLNLAVTYSNIGSIYLNMEKGSEALKFYEKTLKIEQVYLSPNNPDLATTYNNIGKAHKSNGNYQKALEFYRMALEICQKSLPSNHPDFVPVYNNVAAAHYHLGEYPEALQFHKKTLAVEEKSLPSDHPDTAITHCSIGLLCKTMEDYDQALTAYQKALEICQTSRFSNPLYLATIYSNIATLHHSRQEYMKALELYDKTLEIERKFLHSDHPELARTYNNIAAVYDSIKDYSGALQFYQEARLISEKHLSPNHPELGNIYNNMAVTHYNVGHYSQALTLFKQALSILRHSLPEHHSRIQSCIAQIAQVRKHFGFSS